MDELHSNHDVSQLYGQRAGVWTGCDWTTDFGKSHLNLKGLKASQAMLLARASSGAEAADWSGAAEWLNTVEQDASQAEFLAGRAVSQARLGNWPSALACAEKACRFEAKYHRDLVWGPLRQAINDALALTC